MSEYNIKQKDHYIGDGVYAEFTGYDLVLKTDRESRVHYIVFDGPMLEELMRYAKAIGFAL